MRSDTGAFAQLVQQLEPGGHLVRARRLRGGLDARMDVLDIERADGTRVKVSVRRFIHAGSAALERVEHTYRILQFVEEAGVPAPRPLLLDADGKLTGLPAIAMTYVSGTSVIEPREIGPWADELARALHWLHAVTPERFDMSWMRVFLRDEMRTDIERQRDRAHAHSSLAIEIHAALDAGLDRIEWLPPALVHDDFWPGNTVSQRGKISAVIDWTDALLGDPRADVSECRIALALDPAAGSDDAFLRSYKEQAGRAVPDIWYFDLFRGLRALFNYEHWLVGYRDFGVTHLTPAIAGQRLEAFLRNALNAAM